MGKEKRTDNSEGLNKSQIGYKRLETDVYIKLPMEWWNHTDCGTNLTGKSYGKQTEIWVGALFSTSQLKEVAAAATANDEYHMLARDTASVLCCVCWFGKICVIFFIWYKISATSNNCMQNPWRRAHIASHWKSQEWIIFKTSHLDSITQLKYLYLI